MRGFALALVLVGMSLNVALAFEVKEVQGTTATQVLRWSTAAGPIKISLNVKGSDDLPFVTIETALRKALDTWQQVPGQSARFEYVGKTSAVANTDDGVNTIVWLEKGWPYSSSVAAITRYSYFLSDPPLYADSDVLMNGQSYHWGSQNGANSTVSLQQVLTHELGHLLGLAHTGVYNASLYPSLPSNVILTLSPDDKAGLMFLYGSPVNNLQLVNPVMGATYIVGQESSGVPLPVFRWGRGGFSSFAIEFSDTSSFQKKLSFQKGSSSTFALNSAQEKQVLNLSPTKTVYWRVLAGSVKTAPRILHLKKVTELGDGAFAVLRTDSETSTFSPLEVALLPLALICLTVAAFLLWHQWKRQPGKG